MTLRITRGESNLDSANYQDVISVLNPGEVKLYWSAPGDDGNNGRASGYDMRLWLATNGPIDSEWKWQRATQIGGEPFPSLAGRLDSMIIGGLSPGSRYYFCVKAFDEANNISPRSNSIAATAADTSGTPGDFVPGDANGDGVCRGNDLLYLVWYFRGDLPPPVPLLAGDANGDCLVAAADVAYLLQYFKGLGPAPFRGNCGPLRPDQVSDNLLRRPSTH